MWLRDWTSISAKSLAAEELTRPHTALFALGLVSLTAGVAAAIQPGTLALLAAIVLGFAVCLHWPTAGMAMLPVVALLAPWKIETGTLTDLNAPFLLTSALVAAWLLGGLVRGRLAVRVSRVTLPLLLLCAWAGISFLGGLTPWSPFAQVAPISAQGVGLAVIWLSVLLVLLGREAEKPWLVLQAAAGAFVLLGTVLVASQLVPRLGSTVGRYFQEGAAGALFWVWIVVLTFSQAAFNRRLHPILRLACLAVTIAAFSRGLLQAREWSSGWLPPLVALGAMLLFRYPRKTLVSLVLLGILLVPWVPALKEFVLSEDQAYSLMTRMEAAEIATRVIGLSPLLGLGPANYYFYTANFPILGWHVPFSFHNNYLDLAAQTGLVGLVLCLWFFFEFGRHCVRRGTRSSGGPEAAMVAAGFGGLAGTVTAGMLGDWFFPFVYNVGLDGFRCSSVSWLFLGLILGLGNGARGGTGGEGRPENRAVIG